MDLNEYRTRIEKIDIALKEHGWNIKDNSRVITEVDTKQSDFKKRDYKIASETLRNSMESKFVDYLLLDINSEPLAIIEAKRTLKDPLVGQKQAEEYAEDIKRQTGKDVFIFLSNGYEIIFWNKPFENPRHVKGFHSRDDLERIRFQNHEKKPFNNISIKSSIIDRPYQIESVKRVLKGIQKGRRKFLIVQATGTGKTRVAMGLIDVLLRANAAQKILFLADRKALRNQAFDEGFKVWFPEEAKSTVVSSNLDKGSRLYASTIQTFMECYHEFSVGDFDVIISDEAHRSIYNKWKEVFTYFDAIQIGLTATPSDLIEKDTFRFFQCDEKQPTYLYTYEQAVKDGYLADYKVYGARTHFQIEGVKYDDITDSEKEKLEDQGLNKDEMNWDGTDIEKKVAVIGTNEAIVKEFMDNCLMDETGTIPAKSIFFAISKSHAKRLWEAFEKEYPEYKGRLVRIITSDDSRAQELLKEFKLNDFPRIAISVDMLDTGVDIPEICNLAFAKPIFSKTKFWQMIGRGTRHNSTCKHKEWLPSGEKDHFLIMDFWNNFEYFNMNPKGKEENPTDAVTVKIFRTRLQQFAIFQQANDEVRSELVKSKMMDDIKSLPMDSASIKDHVQDIETALSKRLWDNIRIDPIEFLSKKIMPLMKYQTDVNYNTASFTLKCEKLGFALLRNDVNAIDGLKDNIVDDLNCLPRELNQVKIKDEILDKVVKNSFWNTINYNDSLLLIDEFALLMRYKRPAPYHIVVIDMDDVIQQRKIIEYGPGPTQDYVEVYRDKVESRIKGLVENDPAVIKIMNNQPLTEDDIIHLETTLNSPDLYITEDGLQKTYEHRKGTLVQFIKKILGMYQFPEPEKVIEEEFKTFIVANNEMFGADQINFLRTLQTVFSKKHHIEYRDFFDPPFTNFGTNAPMPLFSKDQLKEIINICNRLEKELFSEAA